MEFADEGAAYRLGKTEFAQEGLGEVLNGLADALGYHDGATWGLTERLGMTFVREFDHPKLTEGHLLRRHVLYEVKRSALSKAGSPQE